MSRIDIRQIDGVPTRVLIVTKDSPTMTCENCGKITYHHPDLAKNDPDWCTKCDDDHYRSKMSEKELSLWSLKQMADGKAIAVVYEGEVE